MATQQQQPQRVQEVHLTRASVLIARVLNDFRILAILLVLCILVGIVYGALFMVAAGRSTTALLYIPFALIACHIVQRLARRR